MTCHFRSPLRVLGVVGESGSGKSVTMMSLIGLLPSPPPEVQRGSVMFDGDDLLKIDEDKLRRVRGGKIGFVFQDPMTSLNPVFNVGFQIMEPLREHMGLSKRDARARARELLELVGIPDADRRLDDYPHQFFRRACGSGDDRHRAGLRAETVDRGRADNSAGRHDTGADSGVDEGFAAKLGMAVIWITHDLGVIAGIADRVMVMYGGQVVEEAPVRELLAIRSTPIRAPC